MFIRNIIERILGMDLSGRFAFFQRRYNGNRFYTFGAHQVSAQITRWTHPRVSYSISFGCYCNDPCLNGFSLSPWAEIYSRGNFRTRGEAQAFLTIEVARAAPLNPHTRFIMQICPEGKPRELMEFLDGDWVRTYHDDQSFQCLRCERWYALGPELRDLCHYCNEGFTIREIEIIFEMRIKGTPLEVVGETIEQLRSRVRESQT